MEIDSKVGVACNTLLSLYFCTIKWWNHYVIREGRILPVETPGSGCCQYLSVHWMNSVMVKAYRNGLSSKDLYELSGRDEGHFNAERFQRIWEEEVSESQSGKNAPRKPSLAKCVWKFAKTRLILSSILIMCSIVLQFVGPVSIYWYPFFVWTF